MPVGARARDQKGLAKQSHGFLGQVRCSRQASPRGLGVASHLLLEFPRVGVIGSRPLSRKSRVSG